MIQVHKITNIDYIFETPKHINKVVFVKNKLWMSENEIAKLFDTPQEEIHTMISKTFLEGEYDIFDHIISRFNVSINKHVKYYSLEIILSLGYRLKTFNETKSIIAGNRIIKEHKNNTKWKLSLFQNSMKNITKIFKSLQIW